MPAPKIRSVSFSVPRAPAPVVPTTATVAERDPTVTVRALAEPFKERTPCNWHLESSEDGIVRGRSIRGDVFEGTMAEFNRRMRE